MAAPFNESNFLGNIGGDPAVMHMLLGLFERTADGVFRALEVDEASMASPAYEPVWRHQLHLLRGSALNIGALELARLAESAECAAGPLPLLTKRRIIDDLRDAYADVRHHISELKNS